MLGTANPCSKGWVHQVISTMWGVLAALWPSPGVAYSPAGEVNTPGRNLPPHLLRRPDSENPSLQAPKSSLGNVNVTTYYVSQNPLKNTLWWTCICFFDILNSILKKPARAYRLLLGTLILLQHKFVLSPFKRAFPVANPAECSSRSHPHYIQVYWLGLLGHSSGYC